VGGRLAQAVNYVPSSQLSPNLEAAQRVKTFTKQAKGRPGKMQPLYPLSQQTNKPTEIYHFSLCIAVYATPSKAGAVSKLIEVSRHSLNAMNVGLTYRAQLSDIQDGFGVFDETDITLVVLNELIDDVRAEYNSIHLNTYGSFPQ
jgi:hypothetical protein